MRGRGSGRIEKRYDTTRVIIADDHPIVRAGLKQILSEAHDIEVASEAEDGRMLLERLRKDVFDAVLLDLTMPGMD